MDNQLENIICQNEVYIHIHFNQLEKNIRQYKTLITKILQDECTQFKLRSFAKIEIDLSDHNVRNRIGGLIFHLFYGGLMKNIQSAIKQLIDCCKYEPLLMGLHIEYHIAEELY